jgi:hypothetical protein
MPRLRSLALRLTHNDIGAIGTHALADWIVSFPELCDLELDLVYNPCPAEELAQSIGVAVASRRLRTLTVRLFDRNPRTMWRAPHRFPPMTFQHRTLERITLDVGCVHPEDLVAWTDAVPNDITHLALHAGHPTVGRSMGSNPDSVLGYVVRDWGRFRRLRSVLLDFHGRCGVHTLRGLANAPPALGMTHRLQKLVMRVGGSAGRGLTDICSLLSRLGAGSIIIDWEIGLVDDGMTDEAARTLAVHLSQCNANRLVLDVSHNGIRKQGWEALAKAVGRNANLHVLTFRCNNNPIGEHAPSVPCTWSRNIHSLCLEMEGCGLRFVDDWVVDHLHDRRAHLQWHIGLTGNLLLSHQLQSMRQWGWIVNDGYFE